MRDVEELPDGYARRVPGDTAHACALAGAIALERDSCPFLAFELSFEAHSGPTY